MAVTYDPAVMQRFAEKLYRQAALLVVTWALAFGFAGAVVCKLVHWPLEAGVPLTAAWFLIGALIGNARAFALKLEAQRALCALQTEINTRPKGLTG